MDQAIGIGAWLLRPQLGQLLPWPPTQALPDLSLEHSPQAQHLPPRLVQLLLLLASQPGELWRREALIEALWPDRIVNEEALSRAVSQLRQALGDRGSSAEYIATVPKQGYRLVAPLRTLPSASKQAASAAPRDAAAPPLKTAPPATAKDSSSWAAAPRPQGRHFRTRSIGWSVAVVIALIGLIALGRSWYSDHGGIAQGDFYRQGILAAQRITAHPGVEHFVEVSPDGQYLAYVAERDGVYRAFVVSTAHSDRVWELARSRPDEPGLSQISPVFSPDSRQLALAELSREGCQLVIQSLQPALSAAESPHPADWRHLGPCQAQGLLPILDWSADGRYLAFTDTAEDLPSSAIWEVELSSGQRRQLSRPVDPYFNDARPRYSPDQQWLSFSRGSNAFRELYLLPLGVSHGERQLSFDHQYTQSHTWLSDSSGLIFDSDREGERALWLRPLANQQFALTQPLALGARGAQYPSIARNSAALAYQIAEYEANLWPIAGTELAQQALIRSTKYDNNPVFSPDGQWLAFVSNRSGHGALWLARADGSDQRKLYQPSSGRAAWPVWTPDASALIFIDYQAEGQWLSRLDLDSLSVTRLALPQQGFSPLFSGDGRWFCYTALLPGMGTQVWRVETAEIIASTQQSLNATPASSVGANRGCYASDGRFYFSRHGEEGIYWSDAEDGERHTLTTAQSTAYWQSWMIQGSFIYYLSQQEEHRGIWRYALQSGEEQALSQLLPSALPPNLAVSPQTQELILAMTDRAEADIFYVAPEPASGFARQRQ